MANTKNLRKNIRLIASNLKNALMWLWPLWLASFGMFLTGTLGFYGLIGDVPIAGLVFQGALPLAVIFGTFLLLSSAFTLHEYMRFEKEKKTIVDSAAITVDITDLPEMPAIRPLRIQKIRPDGNIVACSTSPGGKSKSMRLYAQVSALNIPDPTPEETDSEEISALLRSQSEGGPNNG